MSLDTCTRIKSVLLVLSQVWILRTPEAWSKSQTQTGRARSDFLSCDWMDWKEVTRWVSGWFWWCCDSFTINLTNMLSIWQILIYIKMFELTSITNPVQFPESFCFAQHGWHLPATNALWDGQPDSFPTTPCKAVPAFLCGLHWQVWSGTYCRTTVVPPCGQTWQYTGIRSLLLQKTTRSVSCNQLHLNISAQGKCQ